MGGNLVVHEIFQKEDGELGVRLPASISDFFSKKVFVENSITIDASMGYKHVLFDELKNKCGKFSLKIKAGKGVSSFGFLVNYDKEKDYGYAYSFDQRTGLFNFNVQPNTPWNYANFYNVWRKFDDNQEHILTIIYDEDVFVAYIDGDKALSTRVHQVGGTFGLYAMNGVVEFKEIELFTNKL